MPDNPNFAESAPQDIENQNYPTLSKFIKRYGLPPKDIQVPYSSTVHEAQELCTKVALGIDVGKSKQELVALLKTMDITVKEISPLEFSKGVDAYTHYSIKNGIQTTINVAKIADYQKKYLVPRDVASDMAWGDLGHEATHAILHKEKPQISSWESEAAAMEFSQKLAEKVEDNLGEIRSQSFFEELRNYGVTVLAKPE